MIKLFMKTCLIYSGSESNEFEIMIKKKYGPNQHSFTKEDLSDIIVLFAETYFPIEYYQDACLLISTLIKSAIIPYIDILFKESLNTRLSTLLQAASKNELAFVNYKVSSTLQKPSILKLYTEIINNYKEKYMTKYADMFHDCIRNILRDFDLSPYIVPLKDSFIIFGMIVGTGSENKPFRTE